MSSSDYFSQKKLAVETILNIIKDNEGIKSKTLVAKLCVRPPFLSEKNAFTMVKNLFLDKQIIIDDEGVVSLADNKKHSR